MKKVILVVVSVALATMSQAASFKWSTKMGQQIYQSGSTSACVDGTAYLFDASIVKQKDLLTAFNAGSLDLSKKGAISSATIENGKIASTSFTSETAVGFALKSFFATIVDGKLFISSEVSANAQSTSTSLLGFSDKGTSQLAFKLASNGYQGAGWYAIPEPTSGLMILLGLAGLALRRKQA